jgi:uncharacterized membrane protein YqiK
MDNSALSNPISILTYAAIFAVSLIAFGLILSRLYRRASKELAFVRTGLRGQKVIMNGGALVLPVFQDVISVNMNTLRLEVRRSGESGLITKDRMRVDVQAEFFVRVKPTEEAVADAAQTLGLRTQHPESLKELVEGKFVDALRAVAAEMTMEELHEQRVNFVQRVQTTVSEDILKNGLELESVALTSLDQTAKEFLNPNNAFDAQGLAKLTETIEAKRKQRNDIEQDARILIETKNLEAEQRSFEIAKQQEYARLEQEREISIRRAAQAAEIAREQSGRQQEAKQAEIAAAQLIEQSRIQSDRQTQEQEVLRIRALETANIEKQKALELAEQDRRIAIAEKSKAQSEAEAEASKARAAAVKADEEVTTVREREVAERRKAIELVQASETAEKEAIRVTYAAQADKKASEDRAAAARILAEAEADKQRIAAAAEAEALRLRAEAREKEFSVEASGKRAINEAENLVNAAVIEARLRQVLIENLPAIIRESVKPMEQIEGIKIIHVEGLGGGGNGHSVAVPGEAGNGGSLADQMVNSALRYRGQAPLIDNLMKEIGLNGGDINSFTKSLGGEAKDGK